MLMPTGGLTIRVNQGQNGVDSMVTSGHQSVKAIGWFMSNQPLWPFPLQVLQGFQH